MSGSGDHSADSGRQETRLRERSWERTSYSGKFCIVVADPFYNRVFTPPGKSGIFISKTSRT